MPCKCCYSSFLLLYEIVFAELETGGENFELFNFGVSAFILVIFWGLFIGYSFSWSTYSPFLYSSTKTLSLSLSL